MLKKRVIPVLLLKNGRMVKGRQFRDFRETGRPNSAVRIYSSQDADELVFLDIEGSLRGHGEQESFSLPSIVRAAAEECFMPLSAGGGIDSLDKARELIYAGADKVVITSASVTRPKIVREVSTQFGNQCVVAGIDYKASATGHRVWIKAGSEETKLNPIDHASRLVDDGAGEIFLNSIDHDGMMAGYDIDLAGKLAETVPIPVIVCGGAGSFAHLQEALTGTNVAAVACASIFHFGDNNPIRARSFLRNAGLPMRVLK